MMFFSFLSIPEKKRRVTNIAVKNEVMSSMENLAAIAQENAAGTQETSASMAELGDIVGDCYTATGELVDIAKNMNENINKFHLRE